MLLSEHTLTYCVVRERHTCPRGYRTWGSWRRGEILEREPEEPPRSGWSHAHSLAAQPHSGLRASHRFRPGRQAVLWWAVQHTASVAPPVGREQNCNTKIQTYTHAFTVEKVVLWSFIFMTMKLYIFTYNIMTFYFLSESEWLSEGWVLIFPWKNDIAVTLIIYQSRLIVHYQFESMESHIC